MSTDWHAWHDAYERPGSGPADRLTAVPVPLEAGREWFTFLR